MMDSRTMHRMWRKLSEPAALLAAIVACASAAFADWPTGRGNPQRTGAADNQPGPKSPKILWVYESQEHFIASPSLGNKELYVSGIGAFNTAAFHVLSLDPSAANRELWTKRPPYLKQPVVCPPAIVNGKVILGDGMHQTDGAALYCMTETGTPIWQYPVPGTLVHIEGAPTVANGRVYFGGGAAGVLCVDLNRVTLEGKELDEAAAEKLIKAKWDELQARYEADKKKDPDFAIPPSDDALPKPSPKLIWQVGQEKLHVDSAVAVVSGRVLAASAGLEKEKVGDRALFCFDANDGTQKWRTPLDLNPWSGPTVAGNVILVGCSSIRLDPKEIPQAKGQVVALNLETGAPIWKKDLPGGVVSPIAVAGDLAIVTATDGKVRALRISDGQEKWFWGPGASFFAGPAVSTDVAYCADLKGAVRAINLADGKLLWTIDLATDPAVHAPGMIYGSPILKDGKLYVATSNLESAADQQRTVVVCIGEK